MKRIILLFTIALGLMFFIESSIGQGDDECYCWIEGACYTEELICFGTIYCEGEYECEGGWNWIKCDGVFHYCNEPE